MQFKAQPLLIYYTQALCSINTFDIIKTRWEVMALWTGPLENNFFSQCLPYCLQWDNGLIPLRVLGAFKRDQRTTV